MFLPAGIIKLIATLTTIGTIGFAGYQATRPPAVTTDGRARQAIERSEDVRQLRDDNRRNQLRRGVELDSSSRRDYSDRRPRVRPSSLSLVERLWRGLPKPRLRLRLR